MPFVKFLTVPAPREGRYHSYHTRSNKFSSFQKKITMANPTRSMLPTLVSPSITILLLLGLISVLETSLGKPVSSSDNLLSTAKRIGKHKLNRTRLYNDGMHIFANFLACKECNFYVLSKQELPTQKTTLSRMTCYF